jgi:hypothetical protein
VNGASGGRNDRAAFSNDRDGGIFGPKNSGQTVSKGGEIGSMFQVKVGGSTVQDDGV